MIADTKCTVYPALILLALLYTPLGFQTCENSYVRYLAMRSTISPLRPSLAMSTRTDDATRLQTRDDLMQKISDTPRNSPTPKTTTSEILSLVQRLESMCPTEDENVLESSSGGWELLWTAQDQTSPEFDQNPFQTWINPLENQSYSNNPNSSEMGRFNPVLPRNVQDRLEDLGVIQDNQGARSSQSIDLKKKRVRNVVSVSLPALDRRASLTVDVRFQPNADDKRRVDVKFDSCRLLVQRSPVDVTFPLGIFGPTGWLRTGYIDDTIRITRGHKGSVFILSRTSKKKA